MHRAREHTGRLRGLADRMRDEDGFSLAEIMVALTIVSVGMLALAGTASTGARMLAEARQRQAATEIANREIEHIRNIPYDDVALTGTITRSTDPERPDYWVSDAGTGYDHDQNGTHDPLVIDSAGAITHSENITVGPTQLTIYRYVTWVDDPDVTGAQDYKRLVLIAFYRAPVNNGRAREVRASVLFTPGSVFVSGEQAGGTVGSTSSPTPTPSPTPSGSCSGDTEGPTGSFTIVSGTGAEQGYTSSTTITLSLAPVDSCTPITVRFSNDNVTFGSSVTYDALNPTTTWTVPGGDGTKSVWGRFTDGVGNVRNLTTARTIVLDQTLPTVPGTLTRTLSCSGADRTVNLSWGTSSDANLLGYRIYHSVDNGPYSVLSTTSGLTGSDTHKKTLDSVRFKIASYDRAGNESVYTNEISLAKNQCS